MTPRYVIRSPLHALLALEQGMRLEKDGYEVTRRDVLRTLTGDSTISLPFPVFVSCDSHHLVEPQPGDLCKAKGLGYGLCTEAKQEREIIHGKPDVYILFDGSYWPLAEIERIILRNSEPFPKIERIST